MTCSKCGVENRPERRFCRSCGTPLTVECSSCGTGNDPTDRFCGSCGSELGSEQLPRVAAVHSATPERRLVSVLFADIVGFTPISDGEDPEAVRHLLTRYFAVARETIGRYGGAIEKFIGDAVMAVWGTPTAHEDDAERAVRAALELVDAVQTLKAADGSALELRAAVATGLAAVDLTAVGEAMVAGDIVNTASRLQSVAPPSAVLAGEGTVRATSDAIVFDEISPQGLRGKALPVAAWRAVRVVANRGGAGRTERLEAPFVGRDDELRLLKELFHATARERRPRIVSVVGQGGIGKSRLAWEFEKYIDGLVQAVYWHQGRSPAYGEGVTFWALGEMVRARAGIAEGEDAVSTRAKLAASLDEWLPDLDERRWIEPRLAHLLGLESSPFGSQEELHGAWRRFFERVAERGPTVLVFEDLQWADAGVVSFIESLLEWSRQYGILVITLARPELVDRHPAWGAGQRNFTSLTLEPLPEPAMAELLSGLVPGLPSDARVLILARAEGVPLYAVETVRMLVDQGTLVQDDGGYRLARPLAQLAVPETLQALIGARLDGLPSADRAVLQDAAVLGHTFSVDALAAVASRDPSELQERLRTLARREVVVLDADPRSPERGQFRWVQGLIQEVAYSRLARRDKVARHLAAARHFETLGDDELAGVLAGHYVAAYRAAEPGPETEALAAQARLSLLGAAKRARSLHSHDQARGYLEQALEVTAEPDHRADLHERAAAAATAAARPRDTVRHLEAAIELWTHAGERGRAAQATASLGVALLLASDVEPAIVALEQALSDLPDLATSAIGVPVAGALGRAYLLHGEPDRAEPWVEAALGAAERADLVEPTIDLLISKAWLAGIRGRYREALALLDGALAAAVRAGDLQTLQRARMMLSNYLATDGPVDALRIAREGAEHFWSVGMRGGAGALAGNAAYAALQVGEWDWVVERRLEIDRPDLSPISRSGLVGVSAAIAAFRGREAEATALLASLDEAIARSTSPQDSHLDVDAIVAFASGRLEDAERNGFLAMDRINQEPIALQYGIRASAWRRNAGGLARWRAIMDRREFRGRWVAACDLELAAAAAVVRGDHDAAIDSYREALERWQELGLEFNAAMSILDRVVVLDAPAIGEEEADVARGVFARLGAATMLGRLAPLTTTDTVETASGSRTAAATIRPLGPDDKVDVRAKGAQRGA